MLGTIVNSIAIILGSVIGILFSRRISEKVSDIVCSAAGVVTLIIGFKMAFSTLNTIYLALSLIVGGVLGTWWDIDGKILAIGRMLESRFGKPSVSVSAVAPSETLLPPEKTPSTSRFAFAFLNASVLFCVGAMAIVGSFKAGTEGDYTILFTKSVLDGCMSIVFGAALGIGTAFSALSIFLYQGLLTLISGLIKPWVSQQMITELTGIGGAFVIMIGINLLDLRKLKTANYLPALVFMVLLVLLDPYVIKIAAHFI